MITMLTRLRRWVRYQRELGRLMDDMLDRGYGISPWRYEQMRAQAVREVRPAPR